MKLLLLVAAVVTGTSLEPNGVQGRRFGSVPVEIYGPTISGPISLRRDFLQHVLYDYRISPSEVNVRHKGQNPVSYKIPSQGVPYVGLRTENSDQQGFHRGHVESPPAQFNHPQALPYVGTSAEESDQQGFHRGHIESHPAQVNPLFTPYSFNDIFEDLDERVPLRDAVESIPLEAEPYFANPNAESYDGPFSRGDVESYPKFPSPYIGGFEDEHLDAFVVDVIPESHREKYGWAGYRASVESHPLRIPTQDPEESYPMPSQLNGRPFGHLSESTLNEGDLFDDAVVVGDNNPWDSKAGGDLTRYQGTIRSQSGDYKLVCYYGGWSVYRPAPFDFSVLDIDPFSCTHVIYSFAGLKANEYTIQALDEELDIIKGAYKAAVSLKQQNPALKVMIAIGGWNEGGKKYSEMASTKERRDKFIQSVVSFLQEHQFDGLDLDWEYPGASDRGGRWGDKANFADLVEELAVAFKPYGWILSAAVSPAKFRVNEGYDVPRLAQHLDFINIMTYDLRGPWDGKADHHAPIESRPSDAWAFKSLNTKDGINYWAEKGAPKEKLLMGIPFYGRSFSLANPSNTQPGSRAKSGGNEGQYTQERGFLAYYEVCMEERNGGWNKKQDGAGGPYMTKADQWVGYDDTTYVAKKMDMVKTEGLGGAMVWAIDLDDYLGVCGQKWPLLTTMRRGLGIKSTGFTPPVTVPTAAPPMPEPASEPAPEPSPEPEPETTTDAKNQEESNQSSAAPESTTLRPTTLAPTEATPAPNFTCSGPGFHRSSDDCAIYFLCDASLNAYKFVCPVGLVFDTMRRLCNWPRHVKCGKGFAALNKYSAECGQDGLYSDAYNCRMFSWCKDGRASKYSCPYGLFFNPKKGVCTEEGQKFCIPGQSVMIEDNTFDITLKSASGGDKVVCYFTSWAYYRPEPHQYAPEFVDPTLCSHLIYTYSMLDATELNMRPMDPFLDFDYNFYQRILSLKKQAPTLKILLGLGGWVDSVSDKYSRLVNDPEARTRFVQHTTDVLTAYRFDGLDFGWLHPRCWQMQCSRGPASDVAGFSSLIQELKRVFNTQSPPLLLSAAVSPARNIIDKSYDVPTLSRYLDFINVMTYDFHGSWEGKTGHVSPLFFRSDDDYASQNTDFALKHWVKKGADPRKLIVGIPFYGQTFTLANPAQNSLNAPATGPGERGPFTRQKGMLAYFEICKQVRTPGWSKAVDPNGAIGPFAHKGNQWYSYEDPASVTRKANYIRDSGYGGAMIWDLSLDDRLNECCTEPYPLLRAINRVLRSVPYPPPRPGGGNCAKPPSESTPPTPIRTTTYASETNAGKPTESDYGKFNITSPGPATVRPTRPWETSWSPRPRPTQPWQRPTTPKPTISRPTQPWQTPTTPRPRPTTPRPRPTTTTTPRPTTTRTPPTTSSWWLPPSTTTSRTSTWWWTPSSQTTTTPTRRPPRTTPTRRPPTTTPSRRPPTSTTNVPTRPTIAPRPPPTVGGGKHPGDRCQFGEYHPKVGDCKTFLRCRDRVLEEARCAPGLHWNQRSKICDWPVNAKCRSSSSAPVALRPATAEPVSMASPLVITTPDVSVPCNEGTYQRDPANCGGYFLCVHGEWQHFACQPPLQWDQNKRICDWPSNVNCKAVLPPVGEPLPDNPNAVGTSPTPVTAAPTPPPLPATELETVSNQGGLSGDYMVVCYFTNWAWYRPGIGKYKPEDIDPTICTHIVYGFAVLDYSNLVIKPHDSWADIDNKFYEKVTALRAKGIKVTIAIGGWNDSLGDKYSRLVNNPAARSKFISHVVEFIQKYNFDGLDLDWEYPVCWQVDCSKGPKADKENFALWAKELSEAFRPHGLLLSAAVSPSKKVIDEGYDVPMLNRYLDWIAVMTYDFHGHWDKKTGHVAPMYNHPESDYDYFNMDFAIRYWLEKGASKNKIVLGMPLYGQSFSIDDPQNTGLNSPARSGGQAGQFTRARGFLAYYEICHFIRQGWTVVKDPENRIGPYAYSGNQWVSFDDVDMIRKKSQYIRDMGLAGGMVWALDLDDFRNRCGQGSHPLMNTIKAVLGPASRGLPNQPSQPAPIPQGKPVSLPQPEPESQVEPVPPPQPQPVDITGNPVGSPSPQAPGSTSTDMGDYKVVCYFTNWAWYRNGEGKYTPSEIDSSLCTHIVYGFAVLNGNNLLIKPHDTWADYDNKFYERVTAHRSKGVKVLVAIGGWNDSAGNKYSRLVANSASRSKFIEHVITFIKNNNFDGLDLDWEYPVCWQVDCNKGPDSDKANFAAFVRELNMAFKPHGLLLSAAVSPSNKVVDKGYDVPALNQYLDWIAVMTYDYHGQWDKKTGHVAPMYGHADDDNKAFNTNYTIHHWLDKGADRKKLVMGMPMYGQSFTLSQSRDNSLNRKTYGGGEAGRYTRARGFLAYYEICYKIQHEGWTVVRDGQFSMGPYAYKGNQWVGFDDVDTIKYKTEYIKQMGLGGAMIWALDLDDFRNRCNCEHHPLLKAINRGLRNYPEADPGCPTLGGPSGPFMTQRLAGPGITPHIEQRPPVVVAPVAPVLRPVSPIIPIMVTKTACQTGVREAHESDCRKFYECVHGKKEERQCFPGLHWNAQAGRCDWPSEAGCIKTVSPASTQTPATPPATTPATTPTTAPPGTAIATATTPISQPDTGYKVVCYFTNWAWYRQGLGKYKPEDIDPDLCTHIIYGFAVLDGTRLLIKPHDTWADYDNGFYKKVTDMRARGVKVLIAIGGWNDSAGDKYSRLVNNPAARSKFNAHVIEFILKNNFDGLDLDWEYPVCWQVDCAKGNPTDKRAFSAWVKELHTAFQPHGLLLSAAVSPSNKVIDAGYDVPTVNRYLDWIAVMTYDYHGHWDKKTGHVAPMYHHPGHENPAFNANFTIHYWLEKGAERKKLVMGLPMYGQAFGLGWKADGTDLGQHAPNKGQAGQYTRAAGFLAYYEICDKVLNGGFTVVKDPEGRIGPYAHKGKQWFGYDDIEMTRYKSNYIKNMGLGGAMIWALDLDDFRNRCGCEKHPLLRTINRELRNYPVPDPRCNM